MAKVIYGSYDFEEVYDKQYITDDIYFMTGRRNDCWTPKTVFGIVKNGKFHMVNWRKDLKLILNGDKPKNSEEMAQRIANGDIMEISSTLLTETAISMNYLVPANEINIRNTVDWFIHGRGMDYEYGIEWGRKIKSILNEDEIASFHKWEEEVGYVDKTYTPVGKRAREYLGERTIREYNCEDSELESAVYVVMHSDRLFNCAVYLKEWGINEYHLSDVWNYLLCYKHSSSFIEVMHFSDWDKNDPDILMEKYGIKDEVVERENRGLFESSSASLRVGEDYKMAMQIQTSIDDWSGIAVVVPKDCRLSPVEIISAGESVWAIEHNWNVKNNLVVRD